MLADGDMDVIVRPLATDEEIDAYCYLAAETFSTPGGDTAADARVWRQFVETLPEFKPRQWRGAFVGDAPRNDLEHSLRDTFAGGYIIYERELRAGAALLPTVCIGGVVVLPKQRMHGIGRALMRDAIAFAERYGHALLLLDGIPNFYHRWDYADVYDLTEHVIMGDAIAGIAAPGFSVRPATLEDAPALLALYERHYRRYTGSFTRTLDQQRARLARALAAGNPPALAVDEAGAPQGYLLLPRGGDRSHAGEVAADTWPAVAALLQYHAQLVEPHAEEAKMLTWPLPPDFHTYYLLADHLDVSRAIDEGPIRTAAMRGETFVARRTAWMARPVSLQRVATALLPAWQERLNGVKAFNATLTLRMGEEACGFAVTDGAIQLLNEPEPGSPTATMTAGQLVQLVFGYRPGRYLATQPGAEIPDQLLPVLDILFPAGQPWIPWSDSF